MKKRPKVCVVGSINMDMLTSIDRMPNQGETALGGTFKTNPGGKGANQAVAAARLGAEVFFVGAVGDDTFGNEFLEHFERESIDTRGIQVIPDTPTGIATIIISEKDNRIIVSSGANSYVTPECIAKFKEFIIQSDIILLQFEIPMDTIKYAVDFAYEHNIPVIINPAPYQEIPEDVLTKATYFTPNEGEAANIKNSAYDSILGKLIITKGNKGVQFLTSDGELRLISAHQVPVKDTTGAGDTFNGALAAELARGSNLEQAISFANAAAALSIRQVGAQTGMPFKKEVDQFLIISNN